MREIKFKYYMQHVETEERKTFECSIDDIENRDPSINYVYRIVSRHNDKWRLCGRSQYTGLKDIFDREIYEGDIVRDIDLFTGVVTWEDQDGLWFVKDDRKDDGLQEYIVSAEVVGNIYENPEILKGGIRRKRE